MNEFDKMMFDFENKNLLLEMTHVEQQPEETVTQESVGIFDPTTDEFKCKRPDYTQNENTIAYHLPKLIGILDPLLRDKGNEKSNLEKIKIAMFEILNNPSNGKERTRKTWKLNVEKCNNLTQLSFTMTNIYQAAAGNRIHSKAI